MQKLVAGFTVAISLWALAGCSILNINAPTAPSKYTREQQWIVGSIGTDISQIVLFGARKSKPDLDPSKVDLQVKDSGDGSYSYSMTCDKFAPQQRNIKLAKYIWDPDNYVPWVSQLAKAGGVTTGAQSDDTSAKLIATLSDFTPTWVDASNKAVSKALSANPLDPVANEQAALLCALYGLKENAFPFTDARRWINRTVAHLAVAGAAREGKPLGAAGRLSRIALLCLVCRNADAVAAITQWRADKLDDATQSWLRALQIRATGDYRIADLPHARQVERLEYGRALGFNLNEDRVCDYLQTAKVTRLNADWVRIGMLGRDSIESGHVFCENSVNAEVQDVLQDLHVFKGIQSDDNNVGIAELGAQPTLCLVKDPEWCLEPISWGDLSDFHNRHLLAAVCKTYHFLRSVYGVPDEAKQFADGAIKAFSKLPLFPFCVLNLRDEKHENIASDPTDTCAELIRQTPENVNCELWRRSRKRDIRDVVPDPWVWFDPPLPYGTAFEWDTRADGRHWTVPQYSEQRALDPYQTSINYNWAKEKYTRAVSGDQLRAAYGNQDDYNFNAMVAITNAYEGREPEKYARYLEKVCEVDPSYYYSLGEYYKQQDPKRAVAFYEKFVRLCSGVMVANNCAWLVNYYCDHGRKDEALALAKRAAETYSADGLVTLANLYEKMGKLSEAEDYFWKIDERYGEPSYVVMFYGRHRKEFPSSSTGMKKLTDEIYPDGVKMLDASKLSDAPREGIRLTTDSDRTLAAGIHKGAVVVGMNGYAVATNGQYFFARDMVPGSSIEVVFWQNGAYKTAKVNAPDHKLGVEIADYRAAQ